MSGRIVQTPPSWRAVSQRKEHQHKLLEPCFLISHLSSFSSCTKCSHSIPPTLSGFRQSRSPSTTEQILYYHCPLAPLAPAVSLPSTCPSLLSCRTLPVSSPLPTSPVSFHFSSSLLPSPQAHSPSAPSPPTPCPPCLLPPLSPTTPSPPLPFPLALAHRAGLSRD